ncbi:MAG: T9SS type A sorting domain-containing protein, partial [Cyclobacteriaceae bacterium]
DGAMNESLVGFVADATEGYDRLYDADKIGALNGLKLYTLMGQSRLAIQGLPIADESIIPLGVSVDVAGEYTVKIEDIANISDGKFIYLEDTQLGKITKLEKGNEYTFTSGAGVDESRFNLIVSNSMSVLSLDDLDKQGLNVLYNQRGLTISNSDAQASQAQVTILDISGAVLLTEIIEENEGQSVIDFQFETHRVYILQVSTSSKSTTLKIIFQ